MAGITALAMIGTKKISEKIEKESFITSNMALQQSRPNSRPDMAAMKHLKKQ
jgi:hypothetical protein